MERDSSLRGRCKSQDYFNSHAHVERDTIPFPFHIIIQYFNSHAHVERDLPIGVFSIRPMLFQLTRSHGAWLHFFMLLQAFVYFNSHAHVERDNNTFSILKQFKISTHTLTWSVTKKSRGDKMFIAFQLTRSRGAWHYVIVSIKKWYIFQLTRSRGAWRGGLGYYFGTEYISTHTLTWSVTKRPLFTTAKTKISTHTLTWSVTKEHQKMGV